jgi:hypothetical protein
MHILIYFLFHNQYDAGIFGFVIVWRRQFHCDVVCNVTVLRSLNFLLHLYNLHFIKDIKSSWTNLGDKTMSFIAIVNSFNGLDVVFFKLDEQMVDLLTFLICIVMKLFCGFISFLWNRVKNAGKVQLCDKYVSKTCIRDDRKRSCRLLFYTSSSYKYIYIHQVFL